MRADHTTQLQSLAKMCYHAAPNGTFTYLEMIKNFLGNTGKLSLKFKICHWKKCLFWSDWKDVKKKNAKEKRSCSNQREVAGLNAQNWYFPCFLTSWACSSAFFFLASSLFKNNKTKQKLCFIHSRTTYKNIIWKGVGLFCLIFLWAPLCHSE